MKALKSPEADIRISAANGLGYFGDQAKDAVAALVKAKGDRDARVREAAARALSRIDPAGFADPAKKKQK
jgi:HEAT repeat protein